MIWSHFINAVGGLQKAKDILKNIPPYAEMWITYPGEQGYCSSESGYTDNVRMETWTTWNQLIDGEWVSKRSWQGVNFVYFDKLKEAIANVHVRPDMSRWEHWKEDIGHLMMQSWADQFKRGELKLTVKLSDGDELISMFKPSTKRVVYVLKGVKHVIDVQTVGLKYQYGIFDNLTIKQCKERLTEELVNPAYGITVVSIKHEIISETTDANAC